MGDRRIHDKPPKLIKKKDFQENIGDRMNFILPKWGGAMVHSDPQMTDNINLTIPKNNVDKVWNNNELSGEKAGAKGNGVAGNGKIAACTFNGIRDNLVIYDYEGKRLWTSGNKLNALAFTSTPMVSINNEVIACDNEKILMVAPKDDNEYEYEIKWSTDITCNKTSLVIPFSPTIVKEKIIILPTSGPVYVFDTRGKILAIKKLGEDETGSKEYFSTINSACVNDDRVYITTESSTNKLNGRLYALDVNTKVKQGNELLTEAWYYPFIGRSAASPLFIDGTIYFDSYIPGIGIPHKPKPNVYAVTDMKDCYKVLNVQYPHRTMFSFSRDPRGGFWYEDTRGKKLVHFKKEDGTIRIIEEILVKKIVPGGVDVYKPLSCMTICDEKDPVMLISAITYFFKKYVIAVKLNEINSNNNNSNTNKSVLWAVKTANFGINYAGGQFIILKKD